MGRQDSDRIVHISLDEAVLVARNPDIEHERRVAVFDLLEGNHFSLRDGASGPYRLTLSLSERGLVFDLAHQDGAACGQIVLSMTPFRRIIRDYFMVCESYYEAIRSASADRIETIDHARRALHNEGSQLLQEKMQQHATLDFDTARRFFTLVSVLQMRG